MARFPMGGMPYFTLNLQKTTTHLHISHSFNLRRFLIKLKVILKKLLLQSLLPETSPPAFFCDVCAKPCCSAHLVIRFVCPVS